MILSKREVFARVSRFLRDPYRAISVDHFAELSGIGQTTFHRVFIKKDMLMSEMVQIRVCRALKAIEDGRVIVTRNRDLTKNIGYRDAPRMVYKKESRICYQDGKFGVKLGVKNANSYKHGDLKEEMEGN